MLYAIDIGNKTTKEEKVLKVGAVIVDKNNKFLCSSLCDGNTKITWDKKLLNELEKNQTKKMKIYLTVNTINKCGEFDLNKLIEKFDFEKIFFGLPDPNITTYMINDPTIILNNIYRFPDNLQREILEQNKELYVKSKQYIDSDSHYSKKRISDFIFQELNANNILIDKDKINKNKDFKKLRDRLIESTNKSSVECDKLLFSLLSQAFDDKYFLYDYNSDARIKSINLRDRIKDLYNIDLEKQRIINIGVGNGQEALELFKTSSDITFVDIAPSGLNNIKKHFPKSKFYKLSADNLSEIRNDSYDLYISLRTYNSAFFNIEDAINEAARVIKCNGTIIISIANAFLSLEDKRIISGLILPGTNFVDLYRGFILTDKVAFYMNKNFSEIKIDVTETEIFIKGIKK